MFHNCPALTFCARRNELNVLKGDFGKQGERLLQLRYPFRGLVAYKTLRKIFALRSVYGG
jgi:hypothetical protein